MILRSLAGAVTVSSVLKQRYPLIRGKKKKKGGKDLCLPHTWMQDAVKNIFCIGKSYSAKFLSSIFLAAC